MMSLSLEMKCTYRAGDTRKECSKKIGRRMSQWTSLALREKKSTGSGVICRDDFSSTVVVENPDFADLLNRVIEGAKKSNAKEACRNGIYSSVHGKGNKS